MKRTKIKTRIIAMVLAMITVCSVLTVSVGTASAADNGISSFSPADAVDNMALSTAKKAIELACGNTAAGKLASTALQTLFTALFGTSSSSEVNDIAATMEALHSREMAKLEKIEELVKGIGYEVSLVNFKNDLEHMKGIYKTFYQQLGYAEISSQNDGELIDSKTYRNYMGVLDNSAPNYTFSQYANTMNDYLGTVGDNSYITTVKHYIDAVGVSDVTDYQNAQDFTDIREDIKNMESDVVLYYCAYIMELQMKYQCISYENSLEPDQSKHKETASYISQISDAGKQLEEINRAYEDVTDNYIDSQTAATVEVVQKGKTQTYKPCGDGDFVLFSCFKLPDIVTTCHFANPALAWSVASEAARIAQDDLSVNFTLNKDWVAPSGDVGLAMKNMYLGKPGFTKNGGLTATTANSFTVDLNSHKIDLTANNGITMFDISGTGNFTLTDSSNYGENPSQLTNRLVGGKTQLSFTDNNKLNQNAFSHVTVSNIHMENPSERFICVNGNSDNGGTNGTLCLISDCRLSGNMKKSVYISKCACSVNNTVFNNSKTNKLSDVMDVGMNISYVWVSGGYAESKTPNATYSDINVSFE